MYYNTFKQANNLREVKMFFNEMLYSDVNPYEVISMTEKKAVIKGMKHEKMPDGYTPKDGEYACTQSGYEGKSITWLITSDANNHAITITKRKDGRWYRQGGKAGKYEVYFSPSDKPDYYYDYNF